MLRLCHITLCSYMLQLFLFLLLRFLVSLPLYNVTLVSCLLVGVSVVRPCRPSVRCVPCQDFAQTPRH